MGTSRRRDGRGCRVPITSNFRIACRSRMQVIISHTERRTGGGEK
jgi:hypothetical protein